MGNDRASFAIESRADLRRARSEGQDRDGRGRRRDRARLRLSLRRGYGAGTSGSALSFTYGLTAEESAPYLKLPAGKELKADGNHLTLVAAVAFPLR